MNSNKDQKIKELISYFQDAGIYAAESADPSIPAHELERFRLWKEKSFHGSMKWMENPLREDPAAFFPDLKKAIVVLVDYRKKTNLTKKPGKFKVSDYAVSRDYHKVFRKFYKKLDPFWQTLWPDSRLRSTIDTAPILEKTIASKTSLVFFGKNTLCIEPSIGSKFFLGVLLTDIDLPDFSWRSGEDILFKRQEMNLDCGSCRICVDACPTNALTEYELNSNRCISYITIEKKNKDDIQENLRNWVFGCDICQDVCPYNRSLKEFLPEKEISHFSELKKTKALFQSLDFEEINSIDEAGFLELFAGTPLMRAGLSGLKANIQKAKEDKK